jgi:membrane fusion protein, multidrug efflux system
MAMQLTDSRPKQDRGTKRPSTLKRMLVMLLLVLLVAGAIGYGFYRHIQALIASAPKPTPVTVSTIAAKVTSWQPTMTAVGSLAAVQGVDVASQAAGLVSAIPVHSGTAVEENAVLVQLNIEPDKAQLASLEAAADLSRKTLSRDTQLLSQRVASQSAVDSDAADLKSKTALAAQQAALIAQKTIRAPFSGDVGIVQVNLGQYITPGTMVVTLQDLSAMNVDFLVPQDKIAALAPGLPVTVTLDSLPGETFPGKITVITPKIDVNTRNLTVRATVANPSKRLIPGMFVRATVAVGAPKQLMTLPLTAITYNSYGATAFIVTPGPNGGAKTVKQVFVTTGETRGDQVAVLTGLEPDQEVVTGGQLKLKSGAAVVVDNKAQPPNEPNPAPQEK